MIFVGVRSSRHGHPLHLVVGDAEVIASEVVLVDLCIVIRALLNSLNKTVLCIILIHRTGFLPLF
jgi:hypothetical protein